MGSGPSDAEGRVSVQDTHPESLARWLSLKSDWVCTEDPGRAGKWVWALLAHCPSLSFRGRVDFVIARILLVVFSTWHSAPPSILVLGADVAACADS